MHDESPSRRSILRGGAVTAAGASLAVAGTATAASAGPASSGRGHRRNPHGALSLSDRQFLRHGLQHLAWLSVGNPIASGEDYDVPLPSPSQFRRSGFTGPQYYMRNSDGMYDTKFERAIGSGLWSVAKFPDADQLHGGPEPGQQLMSPVMRANRHKLFAACFGDEDPYSDTLIDELTDYFALMRRQSPQTLLYTNQWFGEFGDSQMSTYMQACKPDLVSWDTYYFSPHSHQDSGSVTELYDHTNRYRGYALAGHDGTGKHPINFGQYTQGYQGDPWPPVGPYIISQSQLSLVPYVSWAMGAKLLDLFRWTWLAPYKNYGLLNYQDGSVTPQYHQYVRLNREMANLSDALVRLRTHTVGIVRGKTNPSSPVATSKSTVADWTADIDPETRITDIRVTNTGGANGGLPGDVMIGSFRTLPGLSHHEMGGHVRPDGAAFMLVNALAMPNSDVGDRHGHGGRWSETRQRINVTVHPRRRSERLVRVDRETGRQVPVHFHRSRGAERTFAVEIGGGQGELYLWK